MDKKHIITKDTYIEKVDNITTDYIENQLVERFGQIIRWAITDMKDSLIKIVVTYEEK